MISINMKYILIQDLMNELENIMKIFTTQIKIEVSKEDENYSERNLIEQERSEKRILLKITN
jgi:hypothetical protein